MADARPFDPALFADAAIDAETANLNSDMIQMLTGQPEWWIVGAAAMRAAPARRRAVSGSRYVEPRTNLDHYWQGWQRRNAQGRLPHPDSPDRDNVVVVLRVLSAVCVASERRCRILSCRSAIDMQQFYNAFLPTITDRCVPDISPLYADLKGLCPALFSVGTLKS
jgi:hypothetical protein